MSTRAQAAELARFARAHLRAHLGEVREVPASEIPSAPWATTFGASFVTLRRPDGALQGCIGTLEPYQALRDDVAENVVAAATRDPRGWPLEPGEVDELEVEVSILSPLERVAREEELRAGIDGVVISSGARRATFLPVMWERFASRDELMAALRAKAGIGPRSPLEIWRYTVEHHVEPGLSGALVARSN